MKNIKKQYGEVSLFVVIFSALLITIVTVSFIRLMIQSQQQATATDLSQSAYDSAQVGVEDAKRALLRLQSICNSGGDCDTAKKDFIPTATCNQAVSKLTDVAAAKEPNNEVRVETNGRNTLDQAYTCVKIITSTDDYSGTLEQDTSKFIPLLGVSDFDRIKIEWFTADDKQDLSKPFSIPAPVAPSPLLSQSSWASSPGQNRPSIMRTQLIQFDNSGFKLSDFDSNGSKGSNNTLFLYPMNIIDITRKFSDNARLTPPNQPVQAHCVNSVANVYACSATIQLPVAVKRSDHNQYLNLTSLYKKSSFRVTLSDGANNVKFDGVQPSIDSTGRANDLFRRVQTRVEFTNVNTPYPQAAINITGNFCKDFSITDVPGDYTNNCTP